MRVILLLVVLLAVACTEKKVSFNTVESSRATVNDNVKLQAQRFRSENKLGDYELYVRGDSTQSEECPQGDGWASVDMKLPASMMVSGTQPAIIKLKCSTYSASLGCMTAEDFKTKRYANEEDHCSDRVPFPVPKVAL